MPWKVKRLPTLQSVKILTDHEPPVELRLHDVNTATDEVVGLVALVPEMVAILKCLSAVAPPFGRDTEALRELIEQIERLEGKRDASP